MAEELKDRFSRFRLQFAYSIDAGSMTISFCSPFRLPAQIVSSVVSLLFLAGGIAARAAPPHYDHVVVVLEENHALTQVMGDRANAPFINQLGDGGVTFTNFFALTHPSQPNYLEFFSGSNQGVTTNAAPAGYPLSSPNLGAELIAAGGSFIGYAEDLPAAGDADTVSANATRDGVTYPTYQRKHSPWVNWQYPTQGPDPSAAPPANQLRPSTNQPFSSFPSDFTTLPTVSFVVPNLQNDMHDGSVRMADDWLSSHLGAYAAWARTHNSLLVVTWDEDSFSDLNRIPTIFYGANLRPGMNATTWTMHNLLRTLEESAGSAHAGAAAQVAPMTGMFTTDLPIAAVRLQAGAGSYAGTHDTQIRTDQPTAAFGGTTPLTVAAGAQPMQALIRFDDLASRVPAGAPILSAKLLLTTGADIGDAAPGPIEMHRMLLSWDENATWGGFTDGLSADGTETGATPDFTANPNVLGTPAIFDATAAVSDWLGGSLNRGWALLASTPGSWHFASSEAMAVATRPLLEVAYAASLLEFSAPTYVRDESAGGSVTVTVNRSGWTGGAVSLQYATADGTATAGADYTPTAGTLSWPAGDTSSRTFTVPILPDDVIEADETILLTLSSPTGAVALSGQSTSVITIRETALNNWRIARFGAQANNAAIAGDNADPDGDEQNNLAEYIAHTEPLDPGSRFAATAGLVSGNVVRIQFTARPGCAYTVQRKDALSGAAWQKFQDVTASDVTRNIQIDAAIGTQQQAFYRVVTPPQP